MPSSAERLRLRPSKVNGLVTTPTVSAPSSRAMLAMTGEAPVPVPPPMPAAMNTMSAPRKHVVDQLLATLRRRAGPTCGLPPAPRPRVSFSPMRMRMARVGPREGLGVGIDGHKLDAAHSRLNHAVDGVRAAAADAEDDDARGAVTFSVHRCLLTRARHGPYKRGPAEGYSLRARSSAASLGRAPYSAVAAQEPPNSSACVRPHFSSPTLAANAGLLIASTSPNIPVGVPIRTGW